MTISRLSLNAVDTTSAGLDTLLVATTESCGHPDAELADGGSVALARVGAVVATTLLEGDLRGSVGLSSGSWGSEGEAGESSKEDGGELHVDGWWLGFGEEVKWIVE
jgi:hypothetical protein